MLIGSAFILGILGSLHCVGMCGPIALTISGKNQYLMHKLLYNLGRTTTYMALGFVFGFIGLGLSLAGSQKILSVSMGTLLIITAVLSLPYWKVKIPYLTWMVVRVKNGIGTYLKSGSFYAPYMIGAVNGFLPCGLVYIAIAGAIATGGALEGAAFMGLFGLGTIPALFALSLSWSFLKKSQQLNLRKLVPVFVTLLGILFVLRGLELGIPFVSPILYGSEVITECQ